jgi:hypothetical protein
MSLLCVLGINISPSLSANIYVNANDELIYYIDNMIIKYNLATRDYHIFYVEPTPIASNGEEEQGNQIINDVREGIV